MITAAGVGSGIDIENILSQLNQLERQPVNALNQRRAALDVELSAYGSVKSALNTFQSSAQTLNDGTDFGAFVASSDDEDVFSATATGGKVAESVEIDVLSLATTHRLASKSYTDSDASVGTGTRTFSVAGESFDVTIDSENNTLSGLRDAINDVDENNSIAASIINVDGGSRLVLTARESGTAGQISVTESTTNPANRIDFTEISEAKDANLIIHGFSVTSNSNSVTDVIEGVTLELTGVGKARLDSARDTTSLRASVDEFVTRYNSMAETLNDLSESDLQGDQLPRGIDSRMRQSFLQAIDLGNGATTSALDLGFTFDRYGTLSIDETKYNEALEQGVERYVNAFSRPESGFASRFIDLVDEYTSSTGVLKGREDGVDTRRNSIDDQIDRLEYRIEKTNARLRRQYTQMDQVVTNLQSTSSFLTSRLTA